MLQNKKRLRRFLCVLLCMSVLLLACACASEQTDISTPVGTQERSNALEGAISEVDANISAGEEISVPGGDISIEPTEPVLPEKRETVVELVHTFETGEDGLFSYGFVYDFPVDGESIADPQITAPTHYCADEEGNVYASTKIGIVCLNNGEYFEYQADYSMVQMIVCGNSMFIMFMDGEIQEFSLANGVQNAVLVKSHRFETIDISDGKALMVDIGKNTPALETETDDLYTLAEERLSGSALPYVKSNDASEIAVTRVSNQPFCIYQKYGKMPMVYKCDTSGLSAAVSQNYSREGKAYHETLYSFYDVAGNLTSEFLYVNTSGEKVDCSIPFDAGTVTSYDSRDVWVDKTHFTGVLFARKADVKNGKVYLILYYANYGEIYEITPGYSGVGLTE